MRRGKDVMTGQADIVELTVVEIVQAVGCPTVTQDTPDGTRERNGGRVEAAARRLRRGEVEFNNPGRAHDHSFPSARG
jgi:hypothetical protein